MHAENPGAASDFGASTASEMDRRFIAMVDPPTALALIAFVLRAAEAEPTVDDAPPWSRES